MKTQKLSCSQARNISIITVLKSMGYFPKRETQKDLWFLSPFRSEKEPSFKVSKRMNRWYDFGLGKGGNIIDLLADLKGFSIPQVLNFLNGKGISSFQWPLNGLESPSGIKITAVKHITHNGLKTYLNERKIHLSVARRFVKEVWYELNGKTLFSIGLKNDSDGWELRNKFYKNSTSPKDTSHIKNGKQRLIITEGMFDFLSILVCQPGDFEEYDFLILNSVSFISKAITIAENYESILLYLDNDSAGKKATQQIQNSHRNAVDKSSFYAKHKDLNEWLINK